MIFNDCYEYITYLYEYCYENIWYCCCYKTHYYMEDPEVDNVYILYKNENGYNYNESLSNYM